MIRYAYLSDYNFLNQLAKHSNNQTKYVRINVLDQNDMLITSVTGQAKSGSINLNGASAVRRQGNLVLACEPESADVVNIDNIISINKRVSIEVGIDNPMLYWGKYTEFPILWFPQGVFVYSNPSVSHEPNGISISLNLKDKMALLNGELGGILPAAVNFHPMYNEAGESEPARVRDILYSLLVTFGGLSPQRIIIDNIPLSIKNTVRWTGDKPIYSYNYGTSGFALSETYPRGNVRNVQTIDFNTSMGYIYQDFTYPAAELIAQPGETVTSILDKIKNALGNYEYFFDVYGYFRFQEIQNDLNKGSSLDSWTEAINEKYLQYKYVTKAEVQIDAEKFGSVQNTPSYDRIKNNIVIWGEKSDSKLPIRYHLLIDSKPQLENKTYSGWIYRKLNTKQEPTGPFRYISSEKYASLKGKIKGYQSFSLTTSSDTDWRFKLYLHFALEDYSLLEKYSFLAQELLEEFPKVYNLINRNLISVMNQDKEYVSQSTKGTWLHVLGDASTPDTMATNWFLDILNINEIPELKWMSIDSIGRKDKVFTDKAVNCLFTPKVNNVVYVQAQQDNTTTTRTKIEQVMAYNGDSAQVYQLNSSYWEHIGLGRSTYAAYDALRTQLHEMLGYNEALSVTIAPLYFLEPNQRISIYDPELNVSGDYIINTGTIPLGLTDKMSINVSKATERI